MSHTIESPNIVHSVHPEYEDREDDWRLFRDTMKGGRAYIHKYVERFAKDESDQEFARRKRMTPVPGFSREAVVSVINGIFQRLDGVRRVGGPESYQRSLDGSNGGVDMRGSSMERFMGSEVLWELAFMGKVGIFTDNVSIPMPRTLAQRGNEHPYSYIFVAEDIRNWRFFLHQDGLKLQQVLLRVRSEQVDDDIGFIDSFVEQFHAFWIDPVTGFVNVKFFNQDGIPIMADGTAGDQTFTLRLREIPFHIAEINQSLLQDIAHHQVALTNLESSDIHYAWRANYPYYAEKFHPMGEMAELLQGDRYAEEDPDTEDGEDLTDGGANPRQRRVGAITGIRVPEGVEYPRFIHPSPEPLEVSIKKQAQLKDDIRTLISLSLSNLQPRNASAQSKQFDERGLEAGLSSIGIVLEHAERAMARHWAAYEQSEPASIKYPERYTLKSDQERVDEASRIKDVSQDFRSETARKVAEKERVKILFGGKIPDAELDTIFAEIERSEFPTGDPEIIRSDREAGFITSVTGSLARGWPEGEGEKALQEKEQRDQRMLALQGINPAPRGANDDPEASREEKEASQSPDNNSEGESLTRGRANDISD